ncbi:hypothetical protein N7505_003251 [Penicillium chrysogenum]|uniref:Uncharacterized protein n=1 Tax=Penicillium chrysogenum TaxID=5076 RepID=A0ABQ8WPP5_PENCH|nr:hypothetical protein N7505_003251 [Penicillium chrysogenum]KAJ5285194.1 hypothetical protein N7524_000500 [Penicillium chrysogenum]
MEEDRVPECSAASFEASIEFNLLLDEITARCNRQTKEINKWLLYTKDFRRTIADTLEQERLKKQGADIRAMWSLRTPRTSRTLKTPKTTPNA